MALGYEAAGGIVEKFLPGISIPVLMNTVLPGLVGAAALYPFAPRNWQNVLSLEVEKSWPQLAVTLILILAIGALVSALNGEFYKLYEGRIGWPRHFSDRATARQQRRVNRLYRKAEAERGNKRYYDEIWYQLRIYPLDPETGKRRATHPTLLGNILAGYEAYPGDRYGMDSVFYWPRLWMVVDKDVKEEINKSWAVADGLLNLSAVSFLASLLWLGAAIAVELDFLNPRFLPCHDFFVALGAIVAWFALGYGLYRLSLPFHRQNGEVFKSLFDLHRDKLRKMTSLVPYESDLWKATWAYLQYLLIRCPKCDGQGYVSAVTVTCSNPECAAHLPELVEEFRKSGKFIQDAGETATASSEPGV
jgi:hypothetical protein